MKKLPMLVFALMLPLAACKKKEAETPTPTPGSGSAPAMGSGSAAMAGSGSAAAKPPAKPATGDEMAKRYVECWGFFSAHNWDSLKGCYAAGATSDHVDTGMTATGPDEIDQKQARPLGTAFSDIKGDVELVLINGKNGVTVANLTGTNDGVMKTPMGDMPPTKKKIGMQVAHSVHFTDDGKTVDKERFYADMGEMMGQLMPDPKHPVRPASDKAWGPTETVIAKDDDTEKKNLAAAKAGLEAFNKHDMKAMEASFADDLVWSEIGVPKDWNKKEAVAAHADLFKGFSDLKITPDTAWAAGDYVVAEGTFAGTNDGAVASMGIAKKTGKPMSIHFLQIFKMKDGKLTRSWGFWNSMKFAGDLGMLPPPPAGDKKPGDKKDDKPADKKDDKKPADKKPAK
jgi:steroid delta-isomerase-like uncharacterized protein